MSQVPFTLDNLENLSDEEKKLAKRLIRPTGSTPDMDFESQQFIGFLRQLNDAYGAMREEGNTRPLTLKDLSKTRPMRVSSHPPPKLKATG